MGQHLMLDSAFVAVEGQVKDVMIRSIPLIRNKVLKQKVKAALAGIPEYSCNRFYLLDEVVAFPILKRLCMILNEKYRHDPSTQLENLLRQAKFQFAQNADEASLTPKEKARRQQEQVQYDRMLGISKKDPEQVGEVKSLMKCTSTLINILFSVFGSAIACYLLLQAFTRVNLEFRLIWSILTGFAVLIADMILVQRFF